MKKTTKVFSALAFFLLVFSLLASIIEFTAFNRNYYRVEYSKNDATVMTGMSNEDLLVSTETLLDYLQDKRDNIVVSATVNGVTREVFNQRETIHMVDVKELYRNFRVARNCSVLAGVVILLVLLLKEKEHRRRLLQFGFQYGSLLLLGLVIFIAVWGLADFTAFWTSFHEFFFDNDYWLLDPNTSIMINMFPENFWFDLVKQIITIFMGIMVVIGVLLFVPRKRKL